MKRLFELTIIVTLVALGVTLTSPAAAQVQRFTYRTDVLFDWYLTPTDYPCLTETIHAFGSYQEYMNTFVNPSSGVHWTFHQTTNNATAVGLTTGDTYQYSGPLTYTVSVTRTPSCFGLREAAILWDEAA